MRLFAAVRPPGAVLSHLAAALTSVGLGPGTPGEAGPVRWTSPENWHLTLAFYGAVPEGGIHDLDDALATAAAQAAPFDVRLRGAGVFAHRTLWVGLAGDVEPMVALCAAARDAGTGVTTWEDERVRARPHLTVARSTAGRGRGRPGGRERRGGRATEDPLAGPVHALSLYEGPTWTVEELHLVRSEPGRGRGGGPLYTDLARHALGPVAR